MTVAAGCGPAASPRSAALVPIGHGLMGPLGMTASVYATGLPNASAIALDRSGRLWVTTAAYSDHATDALYLVEKAGAIPIKVVADLQTPLGLTWSNDTLYVSSSGRVDSYGGLQGTRFTVHATVVTFPVGVGEVNNIAQAPDGRLDVGISAPCDHCTPASPWSGTIVSFRPDGQGLRVDATGIRAPFGLAFLPGTSDLIVTMNQRDDLGGRTPGDWVALVKQGQNWGFPQCYGQGGARCGAMPKPIAVLEPHAAVGGLAMVTRRLGSSAGSAALVTEWSLGKVQRVALTTTGGRLTGTVTPFLTGLKNPLPVAVDADGAVLVGDWKTGVLYRIANS